MKGLDFLVTERLPPARTARARAGFCYRRCKLEHTERRTAPRTPDLTVQRQPLRAETRRMIAWQATPARTEVPWCRSTCGDGRNHPPQHARSGAEAKPGLSEPPVVTDNRAPGRDSRLPSASQDPTPPDPRERWPGFAGIRGPSTTTNGPQPSGRVPPPPDARRR